MSMLEKLTEHEQRLQALREEHRIDCANRNFRHCRTMMVLSIATALTQLPYGFLFYKYCMANSSESALYLTVVMSLLVMYVGFRMFFYYRKEYRENKEALFLLCLGGRQHA